MRASPPTLTETPRRRPAAYDLYSEWEIEKIHEKADAIFAILDSNGDGEISEDELRSHLLTAGYAEEAIVELHEMLDANPRDGIISQSELREGFVRYPPLLEAPGLGETLRRRPAAYDLYSEEEIEKIHEKADAIFAVLDRNGDGEISEDELRSHLLTAGYAEEAVVELYEMLDTNPRDGAVSQSELREGFVRYPPLLEAPGLGELDESEWAAVYDEADATFAALDLDGNGSLSLAELQEHFAGVEGPSYSSVAVGRIFAKLDADSDGEISLAEFRGGYARYRAMRLALGSGFATGGLQM